MARKSKEIHQQIVQTAEAEKLPQVPTEQDFQKSVEPSQPISFSNELLTQLDGRSLEEIYSDDGTSFLNPGCPRRCTYAQDSNEVNLMTFVKEGRIQ